MTLNTLRTALATHGIVLVITPKAVKNINFRLTVGQCAVSVPKTLTVKEYDTVLIPILQKRLDWIITQHTALLAKQARKTANDWDNRLWGEPHTFADDNERRTVYGKALVDELNAIYPFWANKVGKKASKMTVKSMKTRWGSCNTRTARLSFAVGLAAYPKQCTAYVLVHELCHLHYADHSPNFWAEVQKAMPDYKQWHDLLGNKVDL